MNTIHEGKKPVKCERCGSNIGIHNKNIHPNTVHEGKKTVKCRKCKKCDSNIGIHNKNIHPNTVHEGKRPVKCENCKKLDSNIGIHIKNIHPNNGMLKIASLKCLLRTKFVRKKPLESTISVHKCNKPFW